MPVHFGGSSIDEVRYGEEERTLKTGDGAGRRLCSNHASESMSRKKLNQYCSVHVRSLRSVTAHIDTTLTLNHSLSLLIAPSPMTTRQLLLRTPGSTRYCLQTPSSGALHQIRRSYALSRFPSKRAPGVGRNRENIKPVQPSTRRMVQDEPQTLKDISSADESRTWHTSQHPPTSNAKEGLQRLLMLNNTLIIERYFVVRPLCY